MASSAESSDGDHDVELNVIVRESISSSEADGGAVIEEKSPLLTQAEKPKINIFTLSYPRRKPGVTPRHFNLISVSNFNTNCSLNCV